MLRGRQTAVKLLEIFANRADSGSGSGTLGVNSPKFSLSKHIWAPRRSKCFWTWDWKTAQLRPQDKFSKNSEVGGADGLRGVAKSRWMERSGGSWVGITEALLSTLSIYLSDFADPLRNLSRNQQATNLASFFQKVNSDQSTDFIYLFFFKNY